MLQFALQPAAQSKTDLSQPRGNRLITPDELSRVDGLTIRYRRHWSLGFIEESVTRCRKAGKFYTLLVVGGDVVDPAGSSHLLRLEQLIDLLGSTYARDSLCWGVHVALPPHRHSEELFWGNPTPTRVLSANRRIMTAWTNAFPRQVKILAGSANDPAGMRTLIKYGLILSGEKFTYKINSLSAKTAVKGWEGTDLVVEAVKLGASFGFEMLCGSNETRFGGTWKQAMANKVAIENRAGKTAAYCARYRFDVGK